MPDKTIKDRKDRRCKASLLIAKASGGLAHKGKLLAPLAWALKQLSLQVLPPHDRKKVKSMRKALKKHVAKREESMDADHILSQDISNLTPPLAPSNTPNNKKPNIKRYS